MIKQKLNKVMSTTKDRAINAIMEVFNVDEKTATKYYNDKIIAVIDSPRQPEIVDLKMLYNYYDYPEFDSDDFTNFNWGNILSIGEAVYLMNEKLGTDIEISDIENKYDTIINSDRGFEYKAKEIKRLIKKDFPELYKYYNMILKEADYDVFNEFGIDEIKGVYAVDNLQLIQRKDLPNNVAKNQLKLFKNNELSHLRALLKYRKNKCKQYLQTQD
jgi:hypothetical protein